MKFSKNLIWKFLEFPKLSFPKTIRIFADPETFYIEACLNQIPRGANNAIALDAGAGPQGKKIFLTKKNYRYESSDFENVFDPTSLNRQTYVCSVEDLPMEDCKYDVIISIQVLEHLEKPEKALIEMARVLKNDGMIFLTTNFLYPRHGEPYDYFRFTFDGLISICARAGLEVTSITPHGGFPAMCAQFLHELPLYFRNFIIFGDSHPSFSQKPRRQRVPFLIMMVIPIFIFNFVTQFLALLLHSLDFLDKTSRYTLGYSLVLGKVDGNPGETIKNEN